MNLLKVVRMASIDQQGRVGFFDWMTFCQLPSCPYNTDNMKVSSWWLFLRLSYISCFIVGIIFAVAGFVSIGTDVAAVGVVIVIVGACLAIIGDVLRRFGCGWTKIVSGSAYPRQSFQENADFQLAIPFLPGYPGFRTGGDEIRPDSPPPYVISQGSESPDDPVAGPIISCTCETTVNVNENEQFFVSDCENACDNHPITLETSHGEASSRTESLGEAAIALVPPTGIEHGTLNPPPPPYDFETTDSEDRISWLYDTPPPYGDFV